MGKSGTNGRKAFLIGSLLVGLLVAGCAEIKPYEPRDHREEGPEKGLFTGSEGEFVIFRNADGEQQKMGSEEKKAKIKSGEQQP
jgi:hypothetical protein